MKSVSIKYLAALLALVSARAEAISVSGHISGNVQWSVQQSPVVVTGDIIIDSTATLSISENVHVVFSGNYSFSVSGGASLLINGTAQGPVMFKGDSLQNSFVLWKGVQLLHSSGTIVIKNAVFSHAQAAINYLPADYSSISIIPDFNITNSIFKNNIVAVQGTTQATKGFINSCTFINNSTCFDGKPGTAYLNVPLFTGSSLQMDNCTFINNDIAANRVSKISNSVFRSNHKAVIIEGGILSENEFYDNDTAVVTQSSSVDKCNFFDNKMSVILLPVYGKGISASITAVNIRESYFGGGNTAILADTGTSMGSIKCNRFERNKTAINMAGSYYQYGVLPPDSFHISSNVFESNDTGVFISDLVNPANPDYNKPVIPTISENIFESSKHFTVYNKSYVNFSLEPNYLGDDETDIEDKIYDGDDNASVGYLSYSVPQKLEHGNGYYNFTTAYYLVKSGFGHTHLTNTTQWTMSECVSATTGIRPVQVSKSVPFSAYPNPFDDELTISLLDNEMTGKINIRLFDLKGSVLYDYTTFMEDIYGGHSINTAGLGSGFYVLQVKTEAGAFRYKLLK